MLFMDMNLITRFSKIKQIIYSLGVSPQPPVKSYCCAPAADIECFPIKKKLSVTCFVVAELKKDEYTLGRDASCTIVINESHLNEEHLNLVSKKHFKISHQKDVVYLEEFELTYVNDEEVGAAKKIILKHNARIAIGKLHLKCRYCCNDDVRKVQWIGTSLVYLP
jgi:hypothetical protein